MTLRTHIILSSLVSLALIAVIAYKTVNKEFKYEGKPAPKPQVTATAKAAPVQTPATSQAAATPTKPATADTVKQPVAVAAQPAPSKPKEPEYKVEVQCVRDGNFKENLEKWRLHAGADEKAIQFLTENDESFVRVDNPQGKTFGLKQAVTVVSGGVYRMSAKVRTVKASDSGLLGCRLALYTPGSKEKQISWYKTGESWYEQSLIFTNSFEGIATIYFHLGNAKEASIGDMKGVSLEKIKL